MTTHLSFCVPRSALVRGILIPKYYDPDLDAAHTMADMARFDLPLLGDVLEGGEQGSRLGEWIRREHYGTGDIPYVRTSDLSHWRIRPDFKKGVSVDLYESLRERQDVREQDILFVAHGTYLVGMVAIVTASDRRLVLQDHVFRLRASSRSGIHPYLLLAALSTAYVRRQVRSRQFSADIIDKIGHRHLGIRVPIPRDASVCDAVVDRVQRILDEQTQSRTDMAKVSQSNLRMTRERADAKHGFTVQRRRLVRRILIPKYYDPDLESELQEAERSFGESWVSLQELVDEGYLSATTGVEVGKMAYGTGDIPFLRTSDLAEWEVKRNVKQGVSSQVFAQYKDKASVEANDILLVRDGTYLVGTTAYINAQDTPALFCGGLYRLRMLHSVEYAPFALLAFLNLPVVRREMRARQFTRDVIDTLGYRLLEVRVPSPLSNFAEDVGREVASIIGRKVHIKSEIGAVIDLLEPPSPPQAQGRPGWSMR